MTTRSLPAVWLALGLASTAFAQESVRTSGDSPEESRRAPESASFEVQSGQQADASFQEEPAASPLAVRLEQWNDSQARTWAVHQDRFTGEASLLYGGRLENGSVPNTDAGWFTLGRQMIERTGSLTGLDVTSLDAERAQFLPLAQMGSRDKWTVRFGQSFFGTTVLGAHVNVLFDDAGSMLSVQSTAAVDRPLTGQPLVSAQRAVRNATRAFRAETGLPAIEIGETRLVFASIDGDRSRRTELVWQTTIMWTAQDTLSVGRELWISARDGSTLASHNSVHQFDVSGTVFANSTPGIAPDSGTNPAQSFPVANVLVSSPQGSAITDVNGDFNIVGVNGPVDLTIGFSGSYANVSNSAGAEHTTVQSASGSGNVLTLNAAPSEQTTAQANAYRGLNQMREWIREINPTDATDDFQAAASVNINSVCNASWDGARTNYFLSGSSGSNNCPNTAYSSVIAHEQGHWLNSRYGTGNGSDGMGEGNADVFALYLFDTPINGVDFLNVGQNLRTGLNTLQYCGDGNGGCYGQVHTDGQVWMGAAWKMRARLNVSLGDSVGDLVADSLFLGWMNAYNQTTISSVIEAQWLTLDDIDGNIFNGTPHFADIDGGMRDQGFPGIDLQFFDFQNVTQLTDTLDEVGPYLVDATVTHSFGGSVNGVMLYYSVNNGPWIASPMAPTGPDQYQGSIPGEISPAGIRYYLEASNSPAEATDYPVGGDANPIGFVVGQRLQAFFDDFESDLGWTHATYGDTSNGQDDWQRGVSAAKAGDASSAFSGSTIWGNDIGQGNWNGAYQNDVHAWLRSPIIDCTDALGTTLSFRRWLTVENGQFDNARIRVNGTIVWSNDASTNHVDTAWALQEVNIAPWADGNPSVQIEFELKTDGGLTMGGWCVDDVELFYVAAADTGCTDPVTYCTTSPNSVGSGALINSTGSTSMAAGGFTLQVGACPPNQFGLFFYGPAQQAIPFGQGTLCVEGGATGLVRIRPPVMTDFLGTASQAVDFGVAPFDAGPGFIQPGDQWNFQFWYRDPSLGFNLSDGLSVTFCP